MAKPTRKWLDLQLHRNPLTENTEIELRTLVIELALALEQQGALDMAAYLNRLDLTTEWMRQRLPGAADLLASDLKVLRDRRHTATSPSLRD